MSKHKGPNVMNSGNGFLLKKFTIFVKPILKTGICGSPRAFVGYVCIFKSYFLKQLKHYQIFTFISQLL